MMTPEDEAAIRKVREHAAGEHDNEKYSMAFSCIEWAEIAGAILTVLEDANYPCNSRADLERCLEHIKATMTKLMEE